MTMHIFSATRKPPRLGAEPNGGGYDKEYEAGYSSKVSSHLYIKINSIKVIIKILVGAFIFPMHTEEVITEVKTQVFN